MSLKFQASVLPMRTRGRTTERVTITETSEAPSVFEPACLVVIAGPLLGIKLELGTEALSIGRSESAGLTIPHASVSRQHCRIYKQDRVYWLEDLDSTNKTFVNGKVIDKLGLNDGDRIKLGDSVLKFFDTGSVEANYQKQLVDLAVTDELTGLSNRRHFVGQITQEIADARRHHHSLALIIADLDHFKPVNDTYGHVAGDQILSGLAQLLQEDLPDLACCGRLGGEEFGILLPEHAPADAFRCAEVIRAKVEAEVFTLNGLELRLTLSLGIAMLSDSMQTHSDFLRAADEHMYEAKNGGRNRTVI